MKPILVTHYERRPRDTGNYSLEAIFADVRRRLPDDVNVTVRVAPCHSNGLFPRLRVLFDVWKHRHEFIHFTGDIHFAVLAAKKAKSILTIHDCAGLVDKTGLRAELLKLIWFKLPVASVASVTTVSESSKRDIIQLTGCSPDKIHVIQNSISGRFAPSAKPFNAKMPRILQVGTGFNKNIERVAQALSGVTCQLIVIGKMSASQQAAIKEANLCCENLVNLSESELIEQYCRCDILVFASTFEGFGMPIIEAQRVGRPVITSNCSSMPEVAGPGACLVDPTKVESIREGLQKVISDEAYRESLVTAGFENATRFDANQIADQYLNLYRTQFGSP